MQKICIYSFINLIVIFLSIEFILYPNVLIEPIPGQSYKKLANKQIIPLDIAWKNIWHSINKLDTTQKIAFTNYIIKFIDPDFTEAYIIRGDAYFANKDYIEAITDYTTAIKQQPNNADLYYKRGLVYNYIGDYYPSATNDFEKAIMLNDKQAIFYAEYSYALYASNSGSKADESLSKAIKFDRSYNNFSYEKLKHIRTEEVWQSSIQKAMNYSIIENYILAYKYFQIALQQKYIRDYPFEPNYMQITINEHTNYKYYYLIQIIQSSIFSSHFENAFYIGKHSSLTANLDNNLLAELYMWKAFACAGTYKKELYIQNRDIALNLAPTNPKIYWILGLIYYKIYDDTYNSIKNYQQSLNLINLNSPYYAKISMELAQIYLKINDKQKAHDIAYKLIHEANDLPLPTQNPSQLQASKYFNYAQAYDILGNKQLAKTYYQIAVTLNPTYDISPEYYPSIAEQMQYLTSIRIDIDNNTSIELKANLVQ